MDETESFEGPSPIPDVSPDPHHLQDSQLHIHLEVAPGTRLEVTLDSRAPDGTLLDQHRFSVENPISGTAEGVHQSYQDSTPAAPRFPAGVRLKPDLGLLLLAGVLVVYLITRLTGLSQFPIFFFTDEAVQTVMASDLVRDQFRGEYAEFLPTYFNNGGQYNLSLSVYLQVIPTLQING